MIEAVFTLGCPRKGFLGLTVPPSWPQIRTTLLWVLCKK